MVNMTKFNVEGRSPFLVDFHRRETEDCVVSLSAIEMHTGIKPDTIHSLPALKSHQGFSHFCTFRGCGGKIKHAQRGLF